MHSIVQFFSRSAQAPSSQSVSANNPAAPQQNKKTSLVAAKVFAAIALVAAASSAAAFANNSYAVAFSALVGGPLVMAGIAVVAAVAATILYVASSKTNVQPSASAPGSPVDVKTLQKEIADASVMKTDNTCAKAKFLANLFFNKIHKENLGRREIALVPIENLATALQAYGQNGDKEAYMYRKDVITHSSGNAGYEIYTSNNRFPASDILVDAIWSSGTLRKALEMLGEGGWDEPAYVLFANEGITLAKALYPAE